MGCNTSQEMKTKDGAAAAVSGDEGGTPMENGSGEHQARHGSHSSDSGQRSDTKSPNKHTNHTKSNSIISNGDASSKQQHQHYQHASKDREAGRMPSPKQNGFSYSGDSRQCDKAEISELNDMELGEDEAKAATKIQAVFRGHQVRNTMKKTETSNATAAAANKNGDDAAAAEPTKAELEAEFDPNDKELCDAALKIQAAFRGHLGRKVVTPDGAEDVDIQEITKKVAEELDIDLTDPELHKAATKIQASFRGHKTRKDVTTE